MSFHELLSRDELVKRANELERQLDNATACMKLGTETALMATARIDELTAYAGLPLQALRDIVAICRTKSELDPREQIIALAVAAIDAQPVHSQ